MNEKIAKAKAVKGSVNSEVLEVAYEMALSLFKVGAMDETTMSEVGALCLDRRERRHVGHRTNET